MSNPTPSKGLLGLVLSGGGSRAAYQVGVLRALIPYVQEHGPINIVTGSSIGAVNGVVISACLKHGFEHAVETAASVWRERTFRTTFSGSPSLAFFKAIQVAVIQYASPGPRSTSVSLFDPTPLKNRVEGIVRDNGGLGMEERSPDLHAIAIMTTLEASERKPLLFVASKEQMTDDQLYGSTFDVCYVDSIGASHAFASAALPSVLPPIQLNLEKHQVTLVDGGISDNVPVDPAVRLGATNVIVADSSGRKWWHDHFGRSHDSRDSWEVPAKAGTFCLRPLHGIEVRNMRAFGPLLKESVGSSRSHFISALGPVWPIFKLLTRKLGEEIAYEIVSYVALHPDFTEAMMQLGYEDGKAALEAHLSVETAKAAV